MRVLCAALLAASPAVAGAQARPTASELVARIVARSGVVAPAGTVDTFKAGDPATRVTGVAVTMMATLDVLRRAVAAGANLILTHEPTFYSHRDTLAVLQSESDPVLAAKLKYINDNRLVVWRFHDIPHRMSPDMIGAGTIAALGWDAHRHAESSNVFGLAPTTLDSLAILVGARLGARSVRVAGNGSGRVRRVAITYGFPGFAANRRAMQSSAIDVLIIGEDHEWETIEYATDAIAAGQLQGMIVLGHVPSEQAGMGHVARWLRTFIREVPVDFVPAAEPFRPFVAGEAAGKSRPR